MRKTPKVPVRFVGGCLLALSSLTLAQTATPALIEFVTKDFGWMFEKPNRSSAQKLRRGRVLAVIGPRALRTVWSFTQTPMSEVQSLVR